MTTRVANIRDLPPGFPDTVYVGRPGNGQSGYFGNPVVPGRVCPICRQVHARPGDTLGCFAVYARRRVETDPTYRKRVVDLRGKTLVCFCSPCPCHGDVLAALADELAPRGRHVAVIGTAGRGEAARRLDLGVLTGAYRFLVGAIGEGPVVLRSGGAAWMDHLAVKLNLGRPALGLDLFLPCPWDDAGRRYVETGLDNDPGRISNLYHQRFTDRVGFDSLAEIDFVLKRDNVRAHVGDGFHDRNKAIVRDADVVYAFTWGEHAPEDGGTKHAWDATPPGVEKIHVPLSRFLGDADRG